MVSINKLIYKNLEFGPFCHIANIMNENVAIKLFRQLLKL